MTSAVLTPTTAKPSSRLGGRLFRKPVLPRGKAINYTDPATGATRKLDFTDAMLNGIVDSFDKGAYDTVKFQLADATNTHTLDPQRARGTVRGFELTADTLDMIVEATPDGEKVITENPDLPVSARIVEDLTRADGQKFPFAIQHVLGTLDPRVSGLGGWEAVDLADNVTTVDLSAESYQPTEKGQTMPTDDKNTPTEAEKVREALGLAADASDIEVQAKLAASGFVPKAEAATPAEEETLSAEDLAAIEALANAAPAGAALTAEAQKAIDLANAQLEAQGAEITALKRDSLRKAWAAERTERLHKGTPPWLLDLAEPWCGGDAPTGFVDLANTDTTVEQVRAASADTLRKVMESVSKIDLSVIGESPDPDKDAADTAARQEAVRKHRQSAGI